MLPVHVLPSEGISISHSRVVENSYIYRRFPRTDAMLACPLSDFTLVILTTAPGCGEDKGNEYSAESNACVNVSLAHGDVSRSSQVPAVFHTLVLSSELLFFFSSSTSTRSSFFGAISPISFLASSDNSLWKYDVFLPLTILYPRTWSLFVNSLFEEESFVAPASFFFFSDVDLTVLVALLSGIGSAVDRAGAVSGGVAPSTFADAVVVSNSFCSSSIFCWHFSISF
mmetsp:Transcript_65180/g.76580  ORF Transcript_65180/g.76580 Transcript_65180/m.76580 type:complete len:227 (-) Transcript_65180:685-1365(-)